MDEVDFTVLAAKSVFSDMIDKCPPAETCRDAFDRTAKATIKMASSSGGFGIQQPKRQRRGTMNWTPTGASDAAAGRQPSHRHNQSEHAPFQFDLSLSDGLSSPSLSTTGEMGTGQTPPVGRPKNYDNDTFMGGQAQSHGRPSPSDRGVAGEDGSSLDPALVSSSPAIARRNPHGSSTSGGGSFLAPQFGLQGTMEYPDAQAMEFLHNLGATPNGDLGGVDQAQLDLGFGMNWENMHHEYGEGQQMNPFDNFFFGGPGGGNGNNNTQGNNDDNGNN